MNAEEFLQDFLQHEYDPVKAHDYYMQVRKLKGRAGVTKDAKANDYVTRQTQEAHQKLTKDLKGAKVHMNPKRRIDAAEQRLIRAKSLAARIKDPTVRADMMAKISATEKKLHVLKRKHGVATVPHPKAHKVVPKKKVVKKTLPKTAVAPSRVYTTGRSKANAS